MRKLADRINWIKKPIVNAMALPRRWRRLTALQVRRFEPLRIALNLPKSLTPNFENWFASAPAPNRWTISRPGYSVANRMPVLNRLENRWYFENSAESIFDPVGIAVLSDGSVYGHNGGQYIAADGQYLADLGVENWKYFSAFRVDSMLKLPRPTKLVGRVAVISHPYAYDNFSHWVFDILPKFGLLKEANLLSSIDTFLVGWTEKKYQVETLQQLGVPREKIHAFRPGDHITAREMVVPRLCGYRSMRHRAWALDYLEAEFSPGRPATAKRRLFISRGDAAFRRLHGEEELFKMLEPHGFERITLSGLPLGATIRLFQGAEAVVGSFGSGLMNIAFSPPGTRVVEIVTPEFYNCYHWFLSEERGLEHAVYFGGNGLLKKNTSLNQLTKDISIDVDDCYRFIVGHVEGAGR